ncbi:glycosyl hydrolase 115 family protein [Thalassobellus sediminis]|uniref:glycosyl hydrolase 115 family protein n=1 Tax=Thalassobellus sediminis TaxID=3367753 RepID=UPI00378BE637
MKKIVLSFFMLPYALIAQLNVSNAPTNNQKDFVLSAPNQSIQIYYDKADDILISKAANLFSNDIGLVTQTKPEIATSQNNLKGNIVIIGTIGKSKIIDELAETHPEINQIKGKWERYVIKTIDNPFSKGGKALVIAGSNRRGTAYGVFSISESIGVSPWYWWADIPVIKQNYINLSSETVVSKAPSVKYRGIFLNDEDWGLKPWASKLIDPELNDIGPKTYAKVFELMLRLKANYMWPAMHEVTGAFNKYPENKLVADDYGILMGSAHCEPLLFNNATEWDKETMGEWDYKTNKEGIINQLEKRVKSNAPYENIYTLALRGMHDEGMIGNMSQQEKVEILENAIRDQRKLLEKYIDTNIEDIPQVLIPYKEVMDIYEMGVELPEEVTVVWPDDNYGYIKRLSTQEEQKRSGGSGVYYHVSYLGEPHNNLWMSTTPPNHMYEEMSKAYNTGADRIWILNVGDIKSCEYSTELFLDMAWDIDAFNYNNLYEHHANWTAEIFGETYIKELKDIWNTFYHQAFIRKPEYMGFGYEYSGHNNHYETLVDTKFSFNNYNEVENRLKAYNSIAEKATNILDKLSPELKPAFYQLVYYPIKGADLMNKKMLTAHKNRMYAQQGRSKTNELAGLAKQYSDSLDLITNGYNTLLDGKWDNMMSVKQGRSATHLMPELKTISLKEKPSLGVYPEGHEELKGNKTAHTSLPTFNAYANKTYYIDVVNKGKGNLKWSATTSADWIKLSNSSGKTKDEQRLSVSIDWSKRPNGENIFGNIEFTFGKQKEKVNIATFKPKEVASTYLKGLFVEQNGYISIPAADFHRTNEKSSDKTIVINGLGIENKSVQFGAPLQRDRNPLTKSNASVEYDFYTFNTGWVKVYVYSLPVFPLNPLEKASYTLKIDDGISKRHDITVREYSDAWKENVFSNTALEMSKIYVDKAGKHTLKIMGDTQGMVIQKIVIDMGGLKESYAGPSSTKIE